MKFRLDPLSASGASVIPPIAPVITGGSSSSGGGGAVDSVNGHTGVVVLNAEDVLPSETGNSGKFLTTNGSASSWGTPSGSGDMLKATYDPNTVNGDAFSQDNMENGTTNKNYTATEKTKLAGIASGAQVNTVDSVNTKTGAVVLGADDISDTAATHKFVTSTDITHLGNLSGTNTGDQTDVTGNAGTATVLATARTIRTDLTSTSTASFDGSANITPGVTGTLPVANGGTGRATATTAYGVIAAGTTATGAQQTISPGASGNFLKSAGGAALATFSAIAESDVTNLTTDLAAKAPLASPTFTGTVSGVTSSMVGLGNVNNTSDATKNSASVALTNKDLSSSTNIYPTGHVVQLAYTLSSGVATGTTAFTAGSSIPTITQGTEFMTLTITPKSATNLLVIEVTAMLANSTAVNNLAGAIFQDATTNALAAGEMREPALDAPMMLRITHVMAAGTTSATTFRFRAGITGSTNQVTFNGSAGTVRYGTATKSSIIIREYNA